MSEGGNRWQELNPADAETYAAQFQRLAASGVDVHGEATLIDDLAHPHSRILDAGCGTGRVAVRLRVLGHRCVGVDSDPSMLEQAQLADPEIDWVLADLATVNSSISQLRDRFNVIVAAGNVIPLLAEETEARVVAALADLLIDEGLLVAGFGLDPAHLPIDWAPVDLVSYDRWCAEAGLVLVSRWSTWDREPYEGGGYAVSVHRLMVAG